MNIILVFHIHFDLVVGNLEVKNGERNLGLIFIEGIVVYL